MFDEYETWLCSYSSSHRLFTVIATSVELWEDSWWKTLELDAQLSDPAGNFQVFKILQQSGSGESTTLDTRHIKVEIRADEYGGPVVGHSKFNLDLLGSPTLFGPADLWGGNGNNFIWVSRGGNTIWLDDVVPTTWEPAKYGF
jgi:hypothetical protein